MLWAKSRNTTEQKLYQKLAQFFHLEPMDLLESVDIEIQASGGDKPPRRVGISFIALKPCRSMEALMGNTSN